MFKINLVNLPSPLKIKMDYKFPEVLPVKLQKKEVQPRTVSQLVYPDSGFDGLSEVSVNAVTNEIDENIKSENIKKNISILGVQGNIEELMGTKIEITKNGTYTPEEPYNAFTEVDVNTDDVSEYFVDKLSIGGTTGSALNRSIKKVPPLSISRPSSNYLFYYCSALETIPLIDMSISVNVKDDFYGCYNLTNFGGFQNLGQAYSTTQSDNYYEYTLNLSSCSKLTHDSLMNVINNLYDIATKGVKTQQLVLGSTNIAKLTAEEISICTAKGWSVS